MARRAPASAGVTSAAGGIGWTAVPADCLAGEESIGGRTREPPARQLAVHGGGSPWRSEGEGFRKCARNSEQYVTRDGGPPVDADRGGPPTTGRKPSAIGRHAP